LQDELADLAQQVKTKLVEFRETQAIVGKLFVEKITRESLEKVKGSIDEMEDAHNKLQDVYTQWYDKTNKIIEECKEHKQCAATSGSRATCECWGPVGVG
jgi:argininosuccinate lyase